LEVLRDADIAAGKPEFAMQRYAAIYPEIVENDEPELHRSNYFAAVDIAYLLIQTGNHDQAEKLLRAVIPVINSMPLVGQGGSFWGNARTYALLGRTDAALAELKRGVDAGWRLDWRYAFDYDPIFSSLRDAPEFIAMRKIVAADMAEQLARVRELEASEEILRP